MKTGENGHFEFLGQKVKILAFEPSWGPWDPPEAPYMTVLTKNVIGVIRVIVISFQLWALIFLRDHM